MPFGTCRLCGLDAELQLSHVVPAFVYRWLRDTAGSPFLRNSQQPNRRVQDGPQEYWLCGRCEQRFSAFERAFATNLFHPYIEGSGERFHYQEWLLQFCTSVSWRTLQFHNEQQHAEREPWAVEAITRAEHRWRQYLLGNEPHPGEYRQHLLPFDQLAAPPPGAPATINRYLMRAIQIDLCSDSSSLFTFTKLGRFMVLGFISEPDPSRWSGSRVNANAGIIGPRHYTLPIGFRDYLYDKARAIAEALDSVSDRQRSRIETTFREGIDRFAGSDAFHALHADVEMFGDAAFSQPSQTER